MREELNEKKEGKGKRDRASARRTKRVEGRYKAVENEGVREESGRLRQRFLARETSRVLVGAGRSLDRICPFPLKSHVLVWQTQEVCQNLPGLFRGETRMCRRE